MSTLIKQGNQVIDIKLSNRLVLIFFLDILSTKFIYLHLSYTGLLYRLLLFYW